MRRFFACALMAGTLFASPAHARDLAWTISEATGGVTIVTNGLSKTANRNDELQAGDIVTTAANARAVIVREGEYVMVAPNSRIEIAETEQSGITQIIEGFGNAVYSIRKKLTPHFEVRTPYLAAVVKGTTFSVTVDENGASVQVVEGAVEVSTLDDGASFLAQSGDIARVSAFDIGALDIDGRIDQVIRSPRSEGSEDAFEITQADGSDDFSVAEGETVATSDEEQPAVFSRASLNTSSDAGGVRVAALGEGPTSLSDATGGLISGTIGGGDAFRLSGGADLAVGNAGAADNSDRAGAGEDIATAPVVEEEPVKAAPPVEPKVEDPPAGKEPPKPVEPKGPDGPVTAGGGNSDPQPAKGGSTGGGNGLALGPDVVPGTGQGNGNGPDTNNGNGNANGQGNGLPAGPDVVPGAGQGNDDGNGVNGNGNPSGNGNNGQGNANGQNGNSGNGSGNSGQGNGNADDLADNTGADKLKDLLKGLVDKFDKGDPQDRGRGRDDDDDDFDDDDDTDFRGLGRGLASIEAEPVMTVDRSVGPGGLDRGMDGMTAGYRGEGAPIR